MGSRSKQFRKHAEECLRLERTLTKPEQKVLAAEFAAAWTRLAEWAEKFQVAPKSGSQPAARSKRSVRR
jgi:hypothetical protein